MRKEISPVTAAIVIVAVLVVLGFAAWKYFFAPPPLVPVRPGEIPVGGPGIPPPGMQPGGPAPGAQQGAPPPEGR